MSKTTKKVQEPTVEAVGIQETLDANRDKAIRMERERQAQAEAVDRMRRAHKIEQMHKAQIRADLMMCGKMVSCLVLSLLFWYACTHAMATPGFARFCVEIILGYAVFTGGVWWSHRFGGRVNERA